MQQQSTAKRIVTGECYVLVQFSLFWYR